MKYATNRTAKFNYEFIDTIEAGIQLFGPEVKSVRAGNISLKESYVKIKDGEVYLTQSHIAVPSFATNFARFEETRDRKLLLHKKEIEKLQLKLKVQGLTLIVSAIYQPENSKKIKCSLVLVRGKKTYDKKQTIKERDIKRDMERTIKNY